MLFGYIQFVHTKIIKKSFYYTGAQQKMLFHQGCNYTVSLWGGDGGLGYYDSNPYHGGVGAYISAFVKLKKTMNVTIMVGGAGEDGIIGSYERPQGGWNGGGNAGRDAGEGEPAGDDLSGAGGGSTDIRLLDPLETDTLRSRLLIAGGGSGSAGGYPGAPGGSIGNHYYYNAQDKLETTEVNKNGGGGTNKILEGGHGGDNAYTPGGGGGGGEYGGKGGIGSWFGSTSDVGYSGSSGIFNSSNYDIGKVTLIECLTYKDVPVKLSAGDGFAIITFDDTCLPSSPSESPDQVKFVTTELGDGTVMIGQPNGGDANGVDKCPTGGITIPDTIDGRPVVAIADRAFYGCRGRGPIEIPSSVTSIGVAAFANNTFVTALSIHTDKSSSEESNLSVGAQAFDFLGSENDGGIEVSLPRGISLEESAFEHSNVTSVSFR